MTGLDPTFAHPQRRMRRVSLGEAEWASSSSGGTSTDGFLQELVFPAFGALHEVNVRKHLQASGDPAGHMKRRVESLHLYPPHLLLAKRTGAETPLVVAARRGTEWIKAELRGDPFWSVGYV